MKRYEELLITEKKRKLLWYCHLTRASGLSKTVLQGTVQGRRRRGKQRKKWTDNIAECTGKSFATTQALAQDRQRWRQGRALPRPKPLPRTVRGGDSWCRVQQCNAPTIPGTVTGFVIMIVIVRQVGAGSSVFDEFKPLVPRFSGPTSCF